MKRTLLLIVVVLCAIAPPARAGAGVDITIEDFDFAPDIVTGLTTSPDDPAEDHPLVWTNQDATNHQVREDQDQEGIALRTGVLSDGEASDPVAILFAATWRYVCIIHPTQMHGTVRVRPALYEPGDPGNYEVVNGPNGEAILRLANGAIPETYVFDVQRRIGDGEWTLIRNDIQRRRVILSPNAEGVYRFRTRITHTGSGGQTNWSPPSRTLTIT